MNIRLILNRYIRNRTLVKTIFVTFIFLIVLLFTTDYFGSFRNVINWGKEISSNGASTENVLSGQITSTLEKMNTKHTLRSIHSTTLIKPTSTLHTHTSVSVPSQTSESDKHKSASVEDKQKTHNVHTFFKQFFDILTKAKPTCDGLNDYNVGTCPMKSSVAYWGKDDVAKWKWLSYESLLQCLKIDESSFDDLHKNHKYFMDHFVDLYDSWESHIWDNLSASVSSSSPSPSPSSSFKTTASANPRNNALYHGNGIVVVGGGKYSVLSLLLIEALKSQNVHLPIEILIPPAEASLEKEYCEFLENNHNRYNAKCIYFDRVFPQELLENFEFKGYQYKSVALLASSFENVLLLDADNVPLTDISNVFQSHVYKKFGMILWPDIWRRSTNPKYYDIAEIKINFEKRTANLIDRFTPAQVYTPQDKLLDTEYLRQEVPYHDFEGAIPDVSSETGQLLINKRTHMKSILLSFYYNVYGPEYYYPMFTQNMAGQGDKETFVAAAHVLNESYYQVKSTAGIAGYHRQDNSGFRSVAIYQKNFIQDYDLYEISKRKTYEKYDIKDVNNGKWTFRNEAQKEQSTAKYNPEYSPQTSYLNLFFKNKETEAQNMFAHCNFPKFDPLEMSKKKDFTWEGKHFRVFKRQRVNGFDVEKSFYTTFDTHLCQSNGRVEFSYLNNKIKGETEWNEMCQFIHEKLDFLQENKLE